MMLSKILAIYLIVLIKCQVGPVIKTQVASIRKVIAQRSLIGIWKLTQENNFNINNKNNMINEQSSLSRQKSRTVSFITEGSNVRQAEAYFQAENQGEQASSLYIQLYNGNYSTNSTVIMQIQLEGMEGGIREDRNYTLWANENSAFMTCLLIRNKQLIGKFSIKAKLDIYTNLAPNEEMTSASRIFVKLQSKTFGYYAELQVIDNQYNELIYVQIASTILFLLCVLFAKPKKQVYNISQWMILQAGAFVLVSNFIFLTLALEKLDTILKFTAVLALFNIILVFLFLRNYEKVVLNSFVGFRLRFMAVAAGFGYCWLTYYYMDSITFWTYESFCLLALQINYSYHAGGRGVKFGSLFITLFSMKFPYFYYLLFCPQLTRQPTDSRLIVIFATVNLILLLFIILQSALGSRFLIPKELIPDYYNYTLRVLPEDSILSEDCPICLIALKQLGGVQSNNELASSHQTANDNQNNSQINDTIRQYFLMRTPCGHKYHVECLKQCMERRLICPLCRTDLPPLQSEREESYCC